MIGRAPATAAAAIGALVAGVAAQAAESSVSSLAWALAAGVGLSLMLAGLPLRVLGGLLALLAAGGVAWSAQAGLWVSLAGFVVSALGAVAIAAWGGGWVRGRGGRVADVDPWKAMDEGVDPTDEQDVRSTSQAR